MEHNDSSKFDRISELPSSIIETILLFLPLREMVRTSILSKNWRFHWVTVPQLVFEDDPDVFKYEDDMDDNDSDTSKGNASIVFGVLLQHEGPILKFKLDMSCWGSCFAINEIIPLLSRNGIQDLTFKTRGLTFMMVDESEESDDQDGSDEMNDRDGTEELNKSDGSDEMNEWDGTDELYRFDGSNEAVKWDGPTESDDECYECDKLSSSIFSCTELKHLSLHSCVFQPLTLVGFDKLISAKFLDMHLDPIVTIPCGPLMESLELEIASFTECFSVDAPNLKSLFFIGHICSIGFLSTPLLKVLTMLGSTGKRFNWIKPLGSLPLLENLDLCHRFLEALDSDNFSNELPIVLNSLRMLQVELFSLTSLLSWIKISPNLEKLKVKKFLLQSCGRFQMPEYSECSLMKLGEVEIPFVMKPLIPFIEFLLDISPELKTVYIKTPTPNIDVVSFNSLLKLACPRHALQKVEIVFLSEDSDTT